MGAVSRYAAVWRLPGAPTLLIAGIIGRLGLGMVPLALLLAIEDVTRRYALAAVASGLFAIASAIFGPIAGRIADRVGPTPVLLVTAVVHPVVLVALVLAARAGALPVIYGAAAAAGATFPPLTAAIRGAWHALTAPATGQYHLRHTALAAETTLVELVFVIGPSLVAVFAFVADAATALLGAAVVTFAGTSVVALGRAMRTWRPDSHTARASGLGPLRVEGFPALLLCAAGLGMAFGAAEVAVPAYAAAHVPEHAETVGGVLLAVWSTGSAIGGFWFGARATSRNAPRELAALLGAVAGSFTVYAVMPHPIALGCALIIGGAVIAPALTVENSLVGRLAPPSMLNEAYTWVMTVTVAASAAGGALAGLVADRPGGVRWAFAIGCVSVAVAAVVAAAPRGPIARADARATRAMERELAKIAG
ncbi:MAG TPA: MFS transporter [Micromonospora sp.]